MPRISENDRITNPCEAFLANLEHKGRSPKTIAAWRRALCRFFRFVQDHGVYDARHVPLEFIFDFRDSLAVGYIGRVRVLRYMRRIHAFYIWLAEQEKSTASTHQPTHKHIIKEG